MARPTGKGTRSVLIPLGWSAVVPGVGTYAAYALTMAGSEVPYLLGLTTELKHRATPLTFVFHAIAGTVALVVGPLQSIRWIRRSAPVRLALGRTYVVAVWITCVSASLAALSFDVSPLSRALFVSIAATWFATTTIGMVRAIARNFVGQHEWMIRSYALALFFVTFSVWEPALAATSLPGMVAYPLVAVHERRAQPGRCGALHSSCAPATQDGSWAAGATLISHADRVRPPCE